MPVDLVGPGSQHPKTSGGKLLCWGETGAAIAPEQVLHTLHTLHRIRAPLCFRRLFHRLVDSLAVGAGRLEIVDRPRGLAVGSGRGAALEIVDLTRRRIIFARPDARFHLAFTLETGHLRRGLAVGAGRGAALEIVNLPRRSLIFARFGTNSHIRVPLPLPNLPNLATFALHVLGRIWDRRRRVDQSFTFF